MHMYIIIVCVHKYVICFMPLKNIFSKLFVGNISMPNLSLITSL